MPRPNNQEFIKIPSIDALKLGHYVQTILQSIFPGFVDSILPRYSFTTHHSSYWIKGR